MTLSQLRDDVVTKLGVKLGPLPGGAKVDVHGGRFDLAELQRHARQLPAVAVSVLGVPKVEVVGGIATITVDFGAFVLVKDAAKGTDRWSASLNLAAVIAAYVATTRFGDDDTTRTQNVKAQSFFSAEVEKHGVAIWGVTWRTSQRYVDAAVAESLVPFETMQTLFDLAPSDETVDAEDNVTLEQPEEAP